MVRNCLADHILYVYIIEPVKRLRTTRYLSRKRRGRVFSPGGGGEITWFSGGAEEVYSPAEYKWGCWGFYLLYPPIIRFIRFQDFNSSKRNYPFSRKTTSLEGFNSILVYESYACVNKHAL